MKFKFPDVGEGIHEGEIIEWLVKEGDSVEEDQNIVKVETDKAVVELPSPATGTIVKIHFKVGSTVKVGEVLVEIGAPGAKVKKTPKKGQSVVGELEEAPEEKKDVSNKMVVTFKDGKVVPKTIHKGKSLSGKTSKVKAMPSVRKYAKEKDIDLSKVQGSGKDGAILMRDLSGTSEKAPVKVSEKYDMYGYVDRVQLKGLRKKISENMAEQAKIPMVAHMDEADITSLWNIRQKEKKKLKDVKLTLLPFITKAVVEALKENPLLNSTLADTEIIQKKYYNIGIAVATEDGLMVPVVKAADKKSIVQIAREMVGLAERARKRTIDIQDLKGGSFTITNVGSIGGLFANPILNLGEAAILALGRAYDKPKVIRGRLKVRKVLPLSLTFDHRILDGAHAAIFVNKVKEYLEDPDRLLLDLH